MATLTAFVLAAFVGYAGFWYVGMIEGNFALLMFMATVVTGIYWLAVNALEKAYSSLNRALEYYQTHGGDTPIELQSLINELDGLMQQAVGAAVSISNDEALAAQILD